MCLPVYVPMFLVCNVSLTRDIQTVVSIGITFIHENPEIFEIPDSFCPERWLKTTSKELESKYFVPFSKGPRMCLGIKYVNGIIPTAVS
jgi:cytochrome P450